MSTLRIATRKSALAMWQARHVQELLARHHPDLEVELVPMSTRGDEVIDRPLAEIGGKGLFLKELERAMLAGDADLAVHSMKDVPAELEPGLELVATLPRASALDAWLCPDGHDWQQLPAGSRVGTSSLRRRSQLLAGRPDLEVHDLRGNVDTRLARLGNGDYDAIILAEAGLDRLGLAGHITTRLQPPDWLPAPAQGAIGIEARAGDDRTRELLAPLDDPDTALVIAIERAVAAGLGGSCHVPLAAHARLVEGECTLQALVAEPDGSRVLRADGRAPRDAWSDMAGEVMEALRRQGAAEIIASLSD